MQDNGNAAVQPLNNAQTTGNPAQADDVAGRDPQEGLAAAPADGIKIPGDRLERCVQSLVRDGKVTDEQGDVVRWFYQWAQGGGMSLSAAARAVEISPTSLYRLFTATYAASYDGLVAKLEKFRRVEERRARRMDVGFVETSTWRKIDAVCTQALTMQMPAFIYGPSQMGKSKCLEEFARRNNHGTTKYIRMPCAPSFSYFVKTIGRACFIGYSSENIDHIRDRVCNALTSRNLLIVDEFHQAMVTANEKVSVKVMEFIREIYDRTGCGIVLCATDVGRAEVEQGRNAGTYDQLRRRGMVKLVLPAMPPFSDIRKIAAAFGLPAPEGRALDTIRAIIKTSGLGKFVKYLQAASVHAGNRREKLSWDSFAEVCDGMAALANP